MLISLDNIGINIYILSSFTGGPDGEEECKRLREDVKKAKIEIRKLGKCKVGMSDWELFIRRQAWEEEARARKLENNICWGGGNPTHKWALSEAERHAKRCENISLYGQEDAPIP